METVELYSGCSINGVERQLENWLVFWNLRPSRSADCLAWTTGLSTLSFFNRAGFPFNCRHSPHDGRAGCLNRMTDMRHKSFRNISGAPLGVNRRASTKQGRELPRVVLDGLESFPVSLLGRGGKGGGGLVVRGKTTDGTWAKQQMSDRSKAYRLYLKSDHWQDLRQAKFKAVGRACQICPSASVLHVHHIRYKNFIDVTTDDLAVLCEQCHDEFHFACNVLRINYREIELPEISKIVADIKTTPRYSKWMEKRSRRATIRQERKQPPKSDDRLKQLQVLCLKCSKENYSPVYVKTLISYAQSLISEVNKETVSIPTIDDLKKTTKGFSRNVLEQYGVPWPPPKGWRKRLLKNQQLTQHNLRKPPKKPSPIQLARSVQQWNENYKEGQSVNVTDDFGKVTATKTTSEAWLLGGHTPVIMLEGISGAYDLERVKAI